VVSRDKFLVHPIQYFHDAWALIEKNHLNPAIQGQARLANSIHRMTNGSASNFPFLEPMKTLRVRNLLSGNRVYEFDAYRTLAFKADSGHSLLLFTNNSKDSSAKIC